MAQLLPLLSIVAANRYLLLACLVMAVALGMAYRAGQPSPPAPPKHPGLLEKFRAVEAEMTKKQVEELLGPPNSTDVVFDFDFWQWQDEQGNACLVTFLGDGVASHRRQRRAGGEWEAAGEGEVR
jgi:hypothetical protein